MNTCGSGLCGLQEPVVCSAVFPVRRRSLYCPAHMAQKINDIPRVRIPPGPHWSDHWAAEAVGGLPTYQGLSLLLAPCPKTSSTHPTKCTWSHHPPDGRRGVSLGAGPAEPARQADGHKPTPTNLHQLHHGHRVEEVEPGESVLSHGGVGYVCDLQRGGVADKDRVSAERETVECRDESRHWQQTGLPSVQCTRPLPTAQICCPHPWRKSGKRDLHARS